jgi:hypothetical protein
VTWDLVRIDLLRTKGGHFRLLGAGERLPRPSIASVRPETCSDSRPASACCAARIHTGTNSDVITALRRGSSDSLNQTGQKVVQQNLNIQPTLTIRPGFPVRVIVNRDLVLEPYKG